MHPSVAGGGDAEHVQIIETSLRPMSLSESDGHECWVRLVEPRCRCEVHRPSLSTEAYHHGSGSVTRTSNGPPGGTFFCFGAIAMDVSGR